MVSINEKKEIFTKKNYACVHKKTHHGDVRM